MATTEQVLNAGVSLKALVSQLAESPEGAAILDATLAQQTAERENDEEPTEENTRPHTLADQIAALPPVTRAPKANGKVQPKTAKASGMGDLVTFTHKLIRLLQQVPSKDGKKHKGIHAVYSGFNAALGAKFKLDKPQVFKAVDAMAQAGQIQKHFCRGGVMIYMPGEMPERERMTGDAILRKLGLD